MQMLQLLLEHHRRRDEQLIEERWLQDEEKQCAEIEQEQFDLLWGLQKQGEVNAEKKRKERGASGNTSDAIEAYLTTFKRQMKVYEIEKVRWAFKLAPQLSGRAQQVYTSLWTQRMQAITISLRKRS